MKKKIFSKVFYISFKVTIFIFIIISYQFLEFYIIYKRKRKQQEKNEEIQEPDIQQKKRGGITSALCVIAKQENKYIKEFINHYKNLGINKIILYDNNEMHEENFNEILKDEIEDNYVKLIDFRGFSAPQKIAYDDCYERIRKDYDWIGFYDVDEYLHIDNFKNINKFLSQTKFQNCTSILINWKNYGDNDNIYYEDKPLSIRFTKPFYFSKNFTDDILLRGAAKSLVRGGMKEINWQHFPHFLKGPGLCRPDGKEENEPLSFPKFTFSYLKHFVTKSLEEYIKKLKKGAVYKRR